jgi:hypothetical protein
MAEAPDVVESDAREEGARRQISEAAGAAIRVDQRQTGVIDGVEGEDVVCAKRAACARDSTLLCEDDIGLAPGGHIAAGAARKWSERVIAVKEVEPAGRRDDEAAVGPRPCDIQRPGRLRNLLPANVRAHVSRGPCGKQQAAAYKCGEDRGESQHGGLA